MKNVYNKGIIQNDPNESTFIIKIIKIFIEKSEKINVLYTINKPERDFGSCADYNKAYSLVGGIQKSILSLEYKICMIKLILVIFYNIFLRIVRPLLFVYLSCKIHSLFVCKNSSIAGHNPFVISSTVNPD
jgi:hypothetical protein